MEKAILRTLIYADIFDYPLTIFEIHKWVIGKKSNLRQVENAIKKLVQSSKCKVQSKYYFLPKKDSLVTKRRRNEKQSRKYLQKAHLVAGILKIIPWVKLVGISGSLSMGNVSKKDDIDIFVIIENNRLWTSRLLILVLLSIFNVRRKASDKKSEVGGKICLNLILDTDHLEQTKKDLYTAHEVLQMKVLWQKEGIYHKYLSDNEWVFKFLPNWIASERLMIKDLRFKSIHQSLIINHKSILDWFEGLGKWFQLKIMSKPSGMERIDNGALYFHPQDCRLEVLSQYRHRLQKFSTP